MAEKFYVVKSGRIPGIYTTWAQCLQQVDKFSGAVYKSYKTREEAEEAFSNTSTVIKAAPKKQMNTTINAVLPSLCTDDIRLHIYCDGACTGNPGKSGSGLAIYEEKKMPVLLYGAADVMGTNNTAELKALLHALELAQDSQYEKVAILSDSKYSIECVVNWAYGWKKNGWTKKGGEIKNLELIQTAHAIYENIKSKVVISHVRGHAGVEGNELADRMAVIAASKGNTLFRQYDYNCVADVLVLKAG